MYICMLQNYSFAVYSSFELYVLQYVPSELLGFIILMYKERKKRKKKEKIFYFELLMLIECTVHIL